MTLGYDQAHQVYSTTLLDPCQDFDSFPYSYNNKGCFKALVEQLGGKYECNDYRSTWTINQHTWQAKLTIDQKTSEYQSMEITKDGEPLSISDAFLQNGTVSGRNFTVEDLEKLLNVSISIDQKNMKATITSK